MYHNIIYNICNYLYISITRRFNSFMYSEKLHSSYIICNLEQLLIMVIGRIYFHGWLHSGHRHSFLHHTISHIVSRLTDFPVTLIDATLQLDMLDKCSARLHLS